MTKLIFFNGLYYYLRCFTDMALHSRDAVTVSAAVATRSRADCSSMEGHTKSIILAYGIYSSKEPLLCVLLYNFFTDPSGTLVSIGEVLQCRYIYLHAALIPSLLSGEVCVACGISPTQTMDERQSSFRVNTRLPPNAGRRI